MYQRILVPVDGSATSDAGLAEATQLARLTGAQLRLLHVVDDMPMIMSGDTMVAMAGDVFDLLRKNGERVLQAACTRVKAAGIAVDTKLYDSFDGRLSDRVVQEVAEWPADLIVLGTHGRRRPHVVGQRRRASAQESHRASVAGTVWGRYCR